MIDRRPFLLASAPFVCAAIVCVAQFAEAAHAALWMEDAKLAPDAAMAGDNFGGSVAVSGDQILVGAGGAEPYGAAYLFRWDGLGWTQARKIDAPLGIDHFGSHVAIDGPNMVIGGPMSRDRKGYAGVVTGDGAPVELVPADGPPSGAYGISVAIGGNRAVVGNTNDTAYIFESDGTHWTQVRKVTHGSPIDAEFGASVATDGITSVVGAPRIDRAWVFGDASGGILPPNGQANAGFGQAVDVSGDRMIVGAASSAYIFQRQGTIWTEMAKFVSDNVDWDGYGTSVAIDGRWAIVGAPYDDTYGPDYGSAYLFEETDEGWTQRARLVAHDGANADYFGYSVAIDGNTAVVGAYGHSRAAGAAYVYVIPEPSTLASMAVLGVVGLLVGWRRRARGR